MSQSKMIESINPTVAYNLSSSWQYVWVNLTSKQRRMLNHLFAIITDKYEYEYNQAEDIDDQVDAWQKYSDKINHYWEEIVRSVRANITPKQVVLTTDNYKGQFTEVFDIDNQIVTMLECGDDIVRYLKKILKT